MTTSLSSLRHQLEAVHAAIPEPPEGPLNPIIPPCDGLPPPKGCRCMNSEEVIREVVLLQAEVENSDGPHPPSYWAKLTQAQRDELTARFEASGGVERVAQIQAELLASQVQP